MLQNVTSLRKSAPWPLNMSAGYVSCTAPATRNASLQILFKHPTPAVVFATAAKPTRLCHAEPHPELRPLAHFQFDMCFAPKRRALFEHRKFQKCSERGVFYTFWLGNMLPATTACTFWTSELPKVLRSWSALGIFTWTCASRHNGVHFFIIYLNVQKCSETSNALHHNGVQFLISRLTTRLHTRRFSEPTFRPSRATKHWKNTVFCDFSIFSRTWIFFLRTLSLLIVSFLWLLSPLLFPSVHTVRSLTSKLPSIIHTYISYIYI